jgi:hypothetical protein
MNTLEAREPVREGAAAPALPLAVPRRLLTWPQAALIPNAPVPKPPRSLGDAGFGGIIGEVEVLSPAEEERLQACEGAIQTTWYRIVDVGRALAEIRDSRLYRIDFDTFEDYCQKRWNFKRSKAHYLISGSRVLERVSARKDLPQPTCESQMRPLLVLSLEHAELAWECAVTMAGARPVKARLVKRAVKILALPRVDARPPLPVDRQTKGQLRRIISETMDELLTLLVRKADHADMMGKFEALHGHLKRLFAPRKAKQS